MLDIEMTDVIRDLPAQRVYELDNNKVRIQREDPYGFWYLHLERGQLPEKLTGAYTSLTEAEREMLAYYRDKKREVAKKVI